MENNLPIASIQGFMKVYKPITMAEAFSRWMLEREVKEFLGFAVGGGVVLGDLLINGDLDEKISPELLHGLQNLMGDKADSLPEIKRILTDKLSLGDESVLGMINKIKGQIGENYFVDAAHSMGLEAHLADSGSQEAWDVALGDGLQSAKQYVQVKTYESADAVIHHMQIVADKVNAGIVTDGDKIVHAIDFAVPQDIYAEVSQKAAGLGLSAHVIPFDLSAAEAAEYVQQGFDTVQAIDLGSLFERFAINSASAVALHAVITACLIKKRTDENNAFLHEVSRQGIVSAGGIATALVTETTLKALGYATTAFPAIGAILVSSMVARGVFKRILSRDRYAYRLSDQTNKLKGTVLLLSYERQGAPAS